MSSPATLIDGFGAQALILATGSELHLALAAADQLESSGVGTRVVSLPCLEWFDAQEPAYRDSIIPPAIRARVAVEAGSTIGWWRYVGSHGRVIGIDHFGASADPATLFREAGITVDSIVRAVQESITDSTRD